MEDTQTPATAEATTPKPSKTPKQFRPKATDYGFLNAMTAQFHAGLKTCMDSGNDTFSFDFETDKGLGSFVVLIRPRPAGVTGEDLMQVVVGALMHAASVVNEVASRTIEATPLTTA